MSTQIRMLTMDQVLGENNRLRREVKGIQAACDPADVPFASAYASLEHFQGQLSCEILRHAVQLNRGERALLDESGFWGLIALGERGFELFRELVKEGSGVEIQAESRTQLGESNLPVVVAGGNREIQNDEAEGVFYGLVMDLVPYCIEVGLASLDADEKYHLEALVKYIRRVMGYQPYLCNPRSRGNWIRTADIQPIDLYEDARGWRTVVRKRLVEMVDTYRLPNAFRSVLEG